MADTTFDGSVYMAGSLGLRFRSVTAAHTCKVADDHTILADASGGAFSVTLPPAADCLAENGGHEYVIVNTGATGTVTVDGNAAETINGSATFALSTQYSAIKLRAISSTAWVITDGGEVASAASLSLSGTLGVTGASTLGAVTTSGAVDMSASTVTLGTVDGTVDLSGGTLDASGGLTLAAGEVDSADIANGAVDPVHLATTGFRSIADDGALTLAATDQVIELVSSTTGAKAATMTATHTGHRIEVHLNTVVGGSYTMACDYPSGTSGTLTLDAAGDGGVFCYSGTAWILVHIFGTAGFA